MVELKCIYRAFLRFVSYTIYICPTHLDWVLVVDAFSSSTQEVEAGRSLEFKSAWDFQEKSCLSKREK